jgi:hypothetical protein
VRRTDCGVGKVTDIAPKSGGPCARGALIVGQPSQSEPLNQLGVNALPLLQLPRQLPELTVAYIRDESLLRRCASWRPPQR